ncbi:1-aminocyclopropane-1-carboxylate synthase C [Penicillium concentricum]|uniref:1-aminocyclopropane-1-carboxylate synthase C n=1 Tax=Penicillium concentricum TaxID=293559 RepID=A0A9W9RSC2_9EURO|nr:1-aminocyclopropane-1-carboxylate synthase C [Penicillium concentricum]KAJ5365461.1 1-aminocyclopropane-1-carboxylate synthase C [Penicillium concentricum]
MAAEEGHLSKRGDVYAQPGNRNPLLDILNDQWHPLSNPGGYLSIGVAENTFMQEELLRYVNTHNFTLDSHCLSYGDSFSGSHQLRSAVASFVTRQFCPVQPLLARHVAITSGVGPGVEALSFTLCNTGDGILLGRPFYRGFPASMSSRAGATTIPVSFGNIDAFSMDAIPLYEKAVLDAKARGITVKAIMLCNPHNPVVWDNTETNEVPGFHSVLSINLKELIDPELVHVLWGISKDFGSNGIRLGCIISQQNERLHAALENIAGAFFVWADLFSFFKPRLGSGVGTSKSAQQVEENSWALEARLQETFLKHKLFTAAGSTFSHTEAGWFRLTFALDYDCLSEGLQRLLTALEEFGKECDY